MKNKNIVEDYLKTKALEYRASGHNQFVLKVCPACDDDKFTHCYINQATGMWDCKKCHSKGNFNQLRKMFGDMAIDLEDLPQDAQKSYNKKTIDPGTVINYSAKLLSTNKEHLDYLVKDRQLDVDTLKHFRIGSTGNKISIPIYHEGIVVNIRYRRDPSETSGAKYTQEAGCGSELFNTDIFKAHPKEVIITEGELDAIKLHQQGFKNVVSTTLGATYFPDAWVQYFTGVDKIYVCYDNDFEGKKGALKVAQKLGVERCFMVNIPTDANEQKVDVTDYFNKGATEKDFKELLKQAKQAQESIILHIKDLLPELREKLLAGDIFGLPTGYKQLDEVVGGFRKGRLIILSGLTSTGKSSFASCLGLNYAAMGHPIFCFSLEMPPIDLAKKFLMLKSRLTHDSLKDIQDPSPELALIDKTFLEFAGNDKDDKGLPIYFHNGSGMIKLDALRESIKLAKEKCGAELIIIDHLHYFVHNFTNTTQETAMIVRTIKQIAVELDIPILLLAHLNRGGRTSQRKGLYTPALSDLRDTGAIEQDADQVLFVCRDSENEDKEERKKAFVKVAKNRDGKAGVNISMSFDEETTYFEELIGVDIAQEAKEKDVAENAILEESRLEDVPF